MDEIDPISPEVLANPRTWLLIASALFLLVGLFAVPGRAWAAGGPLGIDHRLPVDNHGIWKESVEFKIRDAVVVSALAGALWEGGKTRLGKTFWQAVDAEVLGLSTTFVAKRIFQRSRPRRTADPNQWFQGCCNHLSFPSGDVTAFSAAVNPFVLEYGSQYPGVYALELLPLYSMVERMKVRAHWQTDVLGGFAVGFLAAWYERKWFKTPFTLSIMPEGIQVGLKFKF